MRTLDKLIDLLLVALGFTGAFFIYRAIFQGGLSDYEVIAGSSVSVLAFWAAVEWKTGDADEPGSWWIGFIERFCLGTGINLLLHVLLTYALYIRRTPFLIFTGGVLAAALLTLRARWSVERERSQRRYLLIGFDSIAQKIYRLMPEPLIGIVTGQPALLPAGAPYLGDLSEIEGVLK
jgi:hypothetical protein